MLSGPDLNVCVVSICKLFDMSQDHILIWSNFSSHNSSQNFPSRIDTMTLYSEKSASITVRHSTWCRLLEKQWNLTRSAIHKTGMAFRGVMIHGRNRFRNRFLIILWHHISVIPIPIQICVWFDSNLESIPVVDLIPMIDPTLSILAFLLQVDVTHALKALCHQSIK